MNKKLFFNENTLLIVYYRYKEVFVSLLIIATCAFIFMQLVFPQIQEWFSVRNEEAEFRKKVEVLKKRFDFLIRLDTLQLDSQVAIVTSALPLDKDFIGIMQAISRSAALSGVRVADYAFAVGELSSVNSSKSQSQSLAIAISLTGNITQVKEFVKRISSNAPLSEVVSLDITERSAVVSLEFYYKPFSSLPKEDTIALVPLSPKDTQLMNLLAGWGKQGPLSNLSAQVASGSASTSSITPVPSPSP